MKFHTIFTDPRNNDIRFLDLLIAVKLNDHCENIKLDRYSQMQTLLFGTEGPYKTHENTSR